MNTITVYGAEWGTAEKITDHLGSDVTPDMLAQWWRRGLVRRVTVGRGQTRTAHYRLDDCIEAEALTRAQARGRPRSKAA